MALIRQRPSQSEGLRAFELATDDAWTPVEGDAPITDFVDAIVPLARFETEPLAILSRSGRTGVRIPNDHGLDAILPWLGRLSLVAIEFPKHVDGRGYSLARLLRERHAFTGELRAVGNVLRDQLLYMHRCGFDAFELDPKYGPGGRDPESALAAFAEFGVYYQAAADVRLPLWKRVSRA